MRSSDVLVRVELSQQWFLWKSSLPVLSTSFQPVPCMVVFKSNISSIRIGLIFCIWISATTFKATSLSLGTPLGQARVDYSAANEYVEAHYGIENYFDIDGNNGVVKEDIYDARQGAYNDHNGVLIKHPKLSDYGFELFENVRIPVDIDWSNPQQVNNKYIRQIRESLIPRIFDPSQIEVCAFWNPTLRGDDLPMSERDPARTKTAPIAATVHIDTDIGACSNATQLFRLLLSEKNRVMEENINLDENRFIKLIESGHRFILLNFWQSLTPYPVQMSPLGVFAPHYSQSGFSFPEVKPAMDQSRWYCFDAMRNDECLVFKQYDRNSNYLSDVWHCGLFDIMKQTSPPPRRNFDVRAFIILKELVSQDEDRFDPTRRQSFLTLQESECFCSKQASERISANKIKSS